MANFATRVPGNPFFMENLTGGAEITYSAADFRAYTAAFHRQQGALGPTDFQVTQADNVGFSIKVAAGSALVGTYVVTMPADLTINLPFAQNPGTTCTHRIYLVVYDEAYDANSSGYSAEIIGLESINGSIVEPPAFTAGYIELATITYKPGQVNVQNADLASTAPHGGATGTPTNLTPEPGYAAVVGTAYPAFSARASNGVVRLRGTIRMTSGAAFSANTSSLFAVLPPTLRPKHRHKIVGATDIPVPAAPPPVGLPTPQNGPMTFVLLVNADGSLTAVMPTGSSAYNVVLDGLSYDLD